MDRNSTSAELLTRVWLPIDDEAEIRLLTVLPTRGRKIETTIGVCRRDSAPPYEALSYTWGNQEYDQTIWCNGVPLPVTKNCKRALRALRARRRASDEYPEAERKGHQYVWIDAICINQEDSNERSAQVANMADIFRNAYGTVIYLGSCPMRFTLRGRKIDQTVLFKHAWFKRTWIIQEIMSSLTLSVLFDGKDLAWGVLEDSKRNETGKWMQKGPVNVPEIIRMRQTTILEGDNVAIRDISTHVRYPSIQRYEPEMRPLDLGHRRESSRQKARRTKGLEYAYLMGILERTNDFGCLDPRDRLFAIISLFEKPTPPLLVPDYSKTVQQVYTDLSWYFLQQNVFLAMYFNASEDRTKGLPSWVRDWEHDSTLYGNLDDRALFAPDSFMRPRNAGFWRGHERIYARRADNCIKVRGLMIGLAGDFSGVYFLNANAVSKGDQEYESRRYHSGPRAVRKGDCVVVLIGFPTPFVIRRVSGDIWKLLGSCIVDELMAGEALHVLEDMPEMWQEPKLPLQDFRIC